MKNDLTQKEIDQMVEMNSNLVKTNYNLNGRIRYQAELLKESRRIIKAVRAKLADEGYLIDGPTIKRMDKYINKLKSK